MNLCCLLLPFLCQDPATAPQAAPRALDVVELKNGDQLVGRVVAEIDGYVEVQLEAGAVVGLASTFVAAIRRGAHAAPAAASNQPPRNEWFVLYDACGTAVGWLTSAVTHRSDGGFTVSEEYEFQDGARRYQVTSLATADHGNAAVSTYFRERISEPVLATISLPGVDNDAQTERIVDERIVEAFCRGDRLCVQRLDRHGRREREIEWPAGASFPLLARAMVRAAPVGSLPVFDPATEELVVRSYAGARQRSVVLAGERLQITELAETTATGRNNEWLDASSRTVRRELAGPALVAMPSNADSAPFAVGAATIAGALVPEVGGTFGLWLPNPAWVARDDQPAGQVALACEAHGASVTLSRIDHLEADASLDTAADAVANWFALLQPDLRISGREPVTVRDRTAVRLLAGGRTGRTATQATVDVIPHEGRYLVLVCLARTAAWEELGADFDFLRRSVELEAQAMSPTLQGPLAEPRRAGRRSPLRAVPPLPAAPPPKVAPAPAKKQPIVRIPSGG